MSREHLGTISALTDGRPEARLSSRGELILLRTSGLLRAYENRCPHKGTSLDWAPGRFLSSDGRFLQCATHAALFRLEDGVCVAGPCAGDALSTVAVVCEGDDIFLEAEADGQAPGSR